MIFCRSLLKSFLLLFLFSNAKALEVLEPPELRGHFPSPSVPGSSEWTPFSGKLVAVSPLNACKLEDVINGNELAGNIAAISMFGCHPNTKCKILTALNVTGIVFLNPYIPGWIRNQKVINCSVVPTVEIINTPQNNNLFNGAQSNDKPIILLSQDPLVWEQMETGLIVFTVVIYIMVVINSSLSIYKLRLFYLLSGKVELTVANLCLSLELVLNCIMIAYAIDPVGSRGILAPVTSYILHDMLACIALINAFLIAYFWHTALRAKSLLENQRRAWIFILIVAILIIILNIVDIIYVISWRTSETGEILLGVLYALCIVVLIGFFIVTGVRLLRMMTGNLVFRKWLSFWLFMNAIVCLLVAIFLFAYVFFPTNDKWGNFLLLFFTDVTGYGLCLVQVASFRPKESTNSDNVSSGKTTKSKSVEENISLEIK